MKRISPEVEKSFRGIDVPGYGRICVARWGPPVPPKPGLTIITSNTLIFGTLTSHVKSFDTEAQRDDAYKEITGEDIRGIFKSQGYKENNG